MRACPRGSPAGEFREDLYYRLRVVEIALPPLRERREDIPELARHFLERFAAREGREVSTHRPRGLRGAARATTFAGNIRELENLLEGAAASLCRGRRDPAGRTSSGCPSRAPGRLEGPTEPETMGEIPNLRALEERHIQRVLKHGRGEQEPGGETSGDQPPDPLPEESIGALSHSIKKSQFRY